MITRNSDLRLLVKLFLKLKLIIGGRLTGNLSNLLLNVLKTLNNIYRKNGLIYLVKYLKAINVSIQQACSGFRLNDIGSISGPRVTRTNAGIPRIIPSAHRVHIKNQSPGWEYILRFWLTVFALVRTILIAPAWVLDTITKSGKVFNLGLYTKFIVPFFNTFVKSDYIRFNPLEWMSSRFQLVHILTAGPSIEGTYSTHPFSLYCTGMSLLSSQLLFDAFLHLLRSITPNLLPILFGSVGLHSYCEDPEMLKYDPPYSVLYNTTLFDSLYTWMRTSDYRHALYKGFCAQKMAITPTGGQVWTHGVPYEESLVYAKNGSTALGRLGFKVEPAGKLRVFAMVDPWTQLLLRPLHKLIFKVLSVIPMDGTFDQHKPLWRLLRIAKQAKLPLYSLDLSAATDRLPVSLQAALLDYWLGNKLGQAWKDLLVKRDYHYSHKKLGSGSVRYAVGQPMGALSSWGMLALTHHFIVQYAAFVSLYNSDPTCFKLFTAYALLGDDLVIGNKLVKDAYLRILADLGVSVGIHKSIMSPKGIGVEFGKRTIISMKDVSPISIKEFLSAFQSAASFAAFSKKYNVNFNKQVKILGYGYKVLGSTQNYKALNNNLKRLFLANISNVQMDMSTLSLSKSFSRMLQSGLLSKANYLFFQMTALKAFARLIRLYHDPSQFLFKTESDIVAHLKKNNSSIDSNTDVDALMGAFLTHNSFSTDIFNRAAKRIAKVLKLMNLRGDWSFTNIMKIYLAIEDLMNIVNVSALKLDLMETKPSSKNPFTQRMLHVWSKIANILVKKIDVPDLQVDELMKVRNYQPEAVEEFEEEIPTVSTQPPKKEIKALTLYLPLIGAIMTVATYLSS